MADLITLAVPLMLGSIVLEIVWDRKHNLKLYRQSDAISSMGTGVIDQVTVIALPWIGGGLAYVWIYKHYAVWHMKPTAPWTYVLAFVGADFCYYWWHRASHRVNVLWAGHVVHHQSEDFNLSTALRQNPVTTPTAIPFYFPMAILGVPIATFAVGKALMILYQFWIHTELIPKLGPLEMVLNTPSHHRVHHGIDPEYVDKNYAGALIVWDRMFGSFVEETHRPTYGVLKPLCSFDPVWAVFEPWVAIGRALKGRSLGDRIRMLFRPPGWTPEHQDPDNDALFDKVRRYDPLMELTRGRVTLVLFILLLAGSTKITGEVMRHATMPGRFLTVGVVLFALAVLGRLNGPSRSAATAIESAAAPAEG